MPKLGEFIGTLLSDAAQARVQADLETLKLAEVYSAHELLRHLPVPRFRLPDISVEFPVLVVASEGAPAKPGGKLFDDPSRDELAKAVRDGLAKSEPPLSETIRKKAVDVVLGRAKVLFADGPRALLSADKISGDLAVTMAKELEAGLRRGDSAARLVSLESDVRDSLKALLIAKLVNSPSLQVGVGAGDIKAHDDNDSVMRVRLTITEDAYELVDRNEGRGFTLTPE